MAELLVEHARSRPQKPALIDETGSTTWGSLNERVNALIHGLRASGVAAGDCIGIVSGNRRELFEMTLACLHGSYRFVPINWHCTTSEIAYVLQDAGCTTVLADDRHEANLPAIGKRIVTGAQYEDLLAASSSEEPDDQGIGAPMFYTSGTTGKPKGVKRTVDAIGHPVGMMQFAAGAFVGRRGFPTPGVALLCGPAYHAAQWTHSHMPLITGSTVVMRHAFDPAEILAVIDDHGVTNIHMVPTQFVRLLRLPHDVKRGFDGSSLQRVMHGAAPCSPAVKRQMIEWWGPKFLEYYGGTEFGIVSMIDSDEWLEHPESVGRPEPNVEVVVLTDDGTIAQPGEQGQLFFTNSSGLDFEYHGDPEKTAAAHREGGLSTLGDVGFVDADGYVHLTDRKIDMIISGGVNIYPAEIEAVLIEHPAVDDVAVFGIPDDEFGERVIAKVALAAGIEPDGLADQLAELCRVRLAGFKVPRSIEFDEHLPRDDNGKLAKHVLREPYWAGRGTRI